MHACTFPNYRFFLIKGSAAFFLTIPPAGLGGGAGPVPSAILPSSLRDGSLVVSVVLGGAGFVLLVLLLLFEAGSDAALG